MPNPELAVRPHRYLVHLRRLARRKLCQMRRVSHRTLSVSLLLGGAALVALVSLGFTQLADLALHWNRQWTAAHGWLALIVTPCALAVLCWLTLRLAPYASGSGIPQVIAGLSLPPGGAQQRLVSLVQALWKIPLTFLAMLAGASVGREGPSVQVGAALMLAWGQLWRRLGVPLRGFHSQELIAAGAAGGLAAAFNAPLAGVIFAIEELGRGTVLRWQRLVLIGVLAAGFLVVAIAGNNPYLGTFAGQALAHNMLWWTLVCCVVNGILGGVFARLLGKGAAGAAPQRWRERVRRHPVATAFGLGLALACLGLLTGGAVYGTGYDQAAALLSGHDGVPDGFGLAKLAATVASYWAGIPGGIFTPALTTGAGIGEQISHWAGPGVDTRVLVLVSMAAFLAAATQAPLTASVVVMEMTGSQPMLFWLLVGALGASVVSRQFCPRPFYHLAAGRFRRTAVVEAGRKASTE
ncbi:chloride-channel protein [Bordetella pertussis]|nr:chloride channel protein [Bordetella pertussis]ETH39797.1 chloride transporter, ClC family [Bordetella pertussis H918]ETH42249.1 chloride transporter, ClC family [Bordetella pertussis H939]ETH46253.1 chloride transporter, ClC family [Bordetella pertussis H921]ETH71404.1 chloride transporter, ClC family [Bordetella pertussis STO1-CHLA-0011]ETH90932.1 chloride transporter, ClC family [Bordetella pertussis STO1-CHOC-0019]ETI00130.1 chloride transporter, ClC family [Bordetella pertussis STO1-C